MDSRTLNILLIFALVICLIFAFSQYSLLNKEKASNTTQYGNGFIDGYFSGRTDGAYAVEDILLEYLYSVFDPDEDPVQFTKYYRLINDASYDAWQYKNQDIVDEYKIQTSYTFEYEDEEDEW